jgi:hypothetical protein
MALTAQFPDIVANLGVNGFSGGNRARAAEINANVLEPLLYLKARPVARASDLDGTVFNTTSASFVDITGATVNITTSRSSRLLIMANVILNPSTSMIPAVTALLDGANQGDATYGLMKTHINTAGNAYNSAFIFLTAAAVSDATHTVKLQCLTNTGTLTINGFSLVVLEVF